MNFETFSKLWDQFIPVKIETSPMIQLVDTMHPRTAKWLIDRANKEIANDKITQSNL